MSKNKKDLMKEAELADEILNIPEDEIWTYRIEGLQAPRIVDKSVSPALKALILSVLAVAIGLSVFFSIRAVSNEEFEYAEIENGYEFVKYSNPGSVREVAVDFVNGDETKPVTEIHEYAFNCDEKITSVTVGKDVTKIDGKSFYSCPNLENIFVDEANPCYRDLDGVLYNKDMTEVICYPSAHDIYLIRREGYDFTLPEDGSITNADFRSALDLLFRIAADGTDPASLTGGDKTTLEKFTKLTSVTDYERFTEDYRRAAGVYVLPSTVTKIGKLAFAYSGITEIYMPVGVKSIGTLGFFKAERLKEIYSYENGADPLMPDSPSVYRSLPDGLEEIGSDAFTYDRAMTYLYLPSSVKEIGHHAFFNMAYKSGDVIEGVAQINAEADRDAFGENTKTGESWLPKLDAGLFKKNVEVIYASEREK